MKGAKKMTNKNLILPVIGFADEGGRVRPISKENLLNRSYDIHGKITMSLDMGIENFISDLSIVGIIPAVFYTSGMGAGVYSSGKVLKEGYFASNFETKCRLSGKYFPWNGHIVNNKGRTLYSMLDDKKVNPYFDSSGSWKKYPLIASFCGPTAVFAILNKKTDEQILEIVDKMGSHYKFEIPHDWFLKRRVKINPFHERYEKSKKN